MSLPSQFNLRNPAVKRLMKEASELKEPTELFYAQPLEDNLFEWHFTVRGPPDTEFSQGVFHGRIVLPSEYPMKPPSIMILTPNGRFELNKKICLSISGYHPESWQPSWSIRTALLAIIGFMPTHGGGAIGSLDYTPEERKVLALKSMDWKCGSCNCKMSDILPPLTLASQAASQEAKELATQISFQDEATVKAASKKANDNEANTESNPIGIIEGGGDVQLRHRQLGSPPSAVAQSPVHHHDHVIVHEQMTGGGPRSSLLVIFVISLLIVFLLFRRLYMMNEWRFHA